MKYELFLYEYLNLHSYFVVLWFYGFMVKDNTFT